MKPPSTQIHPRTDLYSVNFDSRANIGICTLKTIYYLLYISTVVYHIDICSMFNPHSLKCSILSLIV